MRKAHKKPGLNKKIPNLKEGERKNQQGKIFIRSRVSYAGEEYNQR